MPYDDENYDPYSQFTRIMRMSNIFGPQSVGNYQTPQSVMPDQYDPMSRMQELYQPRTELTDRYTDMLSNIPERNPNPGMGSRIGAIMAGLGAGVRPSGISHGQPIGFEGNPVAAMQTYDQALNAPYYRKIADFENRAKLLREGTLAEDRYNTDARIHANQIMTQEMTNRRLDETERRNREIEDRDRKRLDIQQQRADTYRLRSQLPNHRFDFSGPTVLVADPRTGEVKNTGIPTGSLTDIDKISLSHENALEQIGARGAQTREGIRLRGEAGMDQNWTTMEIDNPDKPGTKMPIRVNPDTGEWKPFEGLSGQITRPTTTARSVPSTTRNEEIRDAAGNIIESRRTQSGPTVPRGNTVIMYGPDGKGYSVPVDKTDDAQLRGMTFSKGGK